MLADLRAAAPGLNRLALNLPGFSDAAKASLDSLGDASTVGTTALRRGRDEIHQLAESGVKAPQTSRDARRLPARHRRPAPRGLDRRPGSEGHRPHRSRAGRRDTKGYTGLKGILNYAYYQAGALNQFDQVGHLLHFSLYDIFSGPCGAFSTGHDPQTGEPGVPAQGGGTTTNILDAADCVGWLGPNQPGLNEDLNLPKYDPSVCPTGTFPQVAEQTLCSPDSPAKTQAHAGAASPTAGRGESADTGGTGETTTPPTGTGGDDGGTGSSDGRRPGLGGGVPDDILDQILDLPPEVLDDLPPELQDQLDGSSAEAPSGPTDPSDRASDLLDFLFQ